MSSGLDCIREFQLGPPASFDACYKVLAGNPLFFAIPASAYLMAPRNILFINPSNRDIDAPHSIRHLFHTTLTIQQFRCPSRAIIVLKDWWISCIGISLHHHCSGRMVICFHFPATSDSPVLSFDFPFRASHS